MTFTELIVSVAQDTGLPKTEVARVLRSFSSVSQKALLSGSDVRLRDFGVFYTVIAKQKPLFGGKRVPSGRTIIRFKEARRRHGQVQRRAR